MTLHIPRRLSIDQLRAELELERDRALQYTPIGTRSGGPCGLWIALAEGNDDFSKQDTAPLHELRIIGHETGHLLLGHQGTYVGGDELIRLLLPEFDSGLVPGVPGCTIYTAAEEDEAEIFASLLLERIAAVQPAPAPVAPQPGGSGMSMSTRQNV